VVVLVVALVVVEVVGMMAAVGQWLATSLTCVGLEFTHVSALCVSMFFPSCCHCDSQLRHRREKAGKINTHAATSNRAGSAREICLILIILLGGQTWKSKN
jgi:hypothetical protein